MADQWKAKYQNLDKRYKETRKAEALERKGRTDAERKLFDALQDLQNMTEKKDSLQT